MLKNEKKSNRGKKLYIQERGKTRNKSRLHIWNMVKKKERCNLQFDLKQSGLFIIADKESVNVANFGAWVIERDVIRCKTLAKDEHVSCLHE